MADKSSQLVLSALTRAAADDGVPLHGNKTVPGLFPTTAAGKQAAQRSCEEGLLSPREEDLQAGRPSPVYTITEKGLAYLFDQVSPRQVLEDFVRVLEEREVQVSQLLHTTRQMHMSLEAMRGRVSAVLGRLRDQGPDLKAQFRQFQDQPSAHIDPAEAVRRVLATWPGITEDCPLPELYRRVSAGQPDLALGAFHDALRRLHDSGHVYLHPWTGPMYEIPDPKYALLVGHEIAYYASERGGHGEGGR